VTTTEWGWLLKLESNILCASSSPRLKALILLCPSGRYSPITNRLFPRSIRHSPLLDLELDAGHFVVQARDKSKPLLIFEYEPICLEWWVL